MSYLEMAKQAEAQLRASRDISTTHESNEVTQEVPAPSPTQPRLYYSHPWPDALPGLGLRTIGPFDCCTRCERWSWARYGSVVICLSCARAVRP
jgi:hypothetical protein